MTKKNISVAILLGGGTGTRFSNGIPKQYLNIFENMSAFEKILDTFLNHQMVDLILPVIHKDHQEYYTRVLHKLSDRFLGIETKLLRPCFGGSERKDSVLNALNSISDHNPYKVLIHDVARPFTSPKIISSIICTISRNMGVVPALKVADSVKRVHDNLIYEEVNRDNLHSLQTPQGFLYKEILESYRKFSHLTFTDDSAYFIKDGHQVKIINGDIANSKITFREDIKTLLNFVKMEKVAESHDNTVKTLQMDDTDYSNSFTEEENYENTADTIDKEPLQPLKHHKKRVTLVGQGVDVHEFSNSPEDNKDLMLCGVKIPFHTGLKGHSDADVGLHAVVDAILGALGKGDIGDYFPPSDPKWKGVASNVFLEFARDLLIKENVSINNLDITLLLEAPKISAHKKNMTLTIAKILGIETHRVNIKATTAEKLGFVGRREGVVAMAIISLEGEK